MSQTLQIILGILAAISAIGGFLYWHFKTLNGFKDEISELKLEMKELEKRDELQQQTIDQLNQLYPMLHKVFDHFKNNNNE
ncbi:MAG: hypothetical protein CL840_11550 [Crocinitomicaceae bacterium]|nr:hypothetical protein [Crocinitomicaceae bacterium]|tara:strand:- start:1199 stop:1441 length:243 start_codon:yes stop_codon:yes gene_type:complete